VERRKRRRKPWGAAAAADAGSGRTRLRRAHQAMEPRRGGRRDPDGRAAGWLAAACEFGCESKSTEAWRAGRTHAWTRGVVGTHVKISSNLRGRGLVGHHDRVPDWASGDWPSPALIPEHSFPLPCCSELASN